MQSYILRTDDSQVPQLEADTSFIGGRPCLPIGTRIPQCVYCHHDQTFFFQIAFPVAHRWSGFTLAVFACTSCAGEDSLIPEMLHVPLPKANIPSSFLTDYQSNFRLVVFETSSGRIVKGYTEKIKFCRWLMIPETDKMLANNKVGGNPNWILDDEAPSTYNLTVPMVFLLQIVANYKFGTVNGSPRQIVIDFFGHEGVTKPSTESYYQLFLGNSLYFFGTASLDEKLVYVLTQTD